MGRKPPRPAPVAFPWADREEQHGLSMVGKRATLETKIAKRHKIPAGRLLGLPELPEGDCWLDISAAAALIGYPEHTITCWLRRAAINHDYRFVGPQKLEFPEPIMVLYRLFWRLSDLYAWIGVPMGTSLKAARRVARSQS